MITNKINGLSYIGKSKDIDKRFIRHKYLANAGYKGLLHIDIRKYGFENFELTVLQETKTFEECTELEIKYINQYNTLSPNGYNKSKGPGRLGECFKMTYTNKEEWRHNLSVSHIGKTHVGKPKTEEQKQYLREYFTGKPNPKNAGENNGMYGKPAPNKGKKIYVDENGERHFK